MSGPAIYTCEELTGLLTALYMAGVQPLALRVMAAALGIEWVEVMVRAGKMVEAE